MRLFGGISKLIGWLGNDKIFWRIVGVLFLIGAVVSIFASMKPEAEWTTTGVTEPAAQPHRPMPATADTARQRHSWEVADSTEPAASPHLTPSEEIEYYEANREYYLDDPEDILTYPDEIFDFNAD